MKVRSGRGIEEHDEDGEDGGNRRKQEDEAVLLGDGLQGRRDGPEQDQGDDGAQDGAGRVHAAVEPERFPARFGGSRLRQEGIARGIAHALPRALDHAQSDELRPTLGKGEEDLHRGGKRVARADETLPTPGRVGEPSRNDFHERDDAVREPFLQADDEGVRPEDVNQEEGEDRQDHFAADVGEERHDPKDDDVRGESICKRSPGGSHGITAADGRRRPRQSRRRPSRATHPRTSCSGHRRPPPRRRPSPRPTRRVRRSRSRGS